jgi:hypothetical protein
MAVVLTNAGEEYVVDKLTETVQTVPQYIGWGTGAGTSAKGDTTLFTEAAEARVSGTVTKTGSGSTAKFQNVGTMTSASAQTITNAGCLTATSAGTLVIHGDHTGVVLAIGDQIQYTFTLDPS